MKTSLCRLGILLIGFLFSLELQAIPSFPGAEGFGSQATGGRGGRVILVTNLNASGPGSLQDAVSQSGPRTVVFAVSGIIEGDILIQEGNLTLAGESAPGAGITLAGKLWTEYAYGIDNLIVRFLRVRPRTLSGDQGDAIQFSRSRNFILDHVSVAWGSDETVDLYEAQNVTVQWCTIEASATYAGHPDGDFHNYGLINGPDGGRISLHHNLFAHHSRRNPAIANGPASIRNNVMYDFRDGFVHDNPSNNGGFHIIGNTFMRGNSGGSIFPVAMGDDDGQVIDYWMVDNQILNGWEYSGVMTNPWTDSHLPNGIRYYLNLGRPMSAPHPEMGTDYEAPQKAYESVLGKAGCLPRDVVTRTTVEEVRKNAGSWGRSVPSDLWQGLSTGDNAAVDSDQDGMPDDWERGKGIFGTGGNNANGFDLGAASGYTNLEIYLHEQAAARILEYAELQVPQVSGPFEGALPLFRLMGKEQGYPNYFFTVSPEEWAYVVSRNFPLSYDYEGVSQFVLAGPIRGGAKPVYRFWSGHAYLFSIGEAEKAQLIHDPYRWWKYEGIAFYAFDFPAEGTVPVYRLNFNGGQKFFYTISEEEAQTLVQWPGYYKWALDGIAWWAYPP